MRRTFSKPNLGIERAHTAHEQTHQAKPFHEGEQPFSYRHAVINRVQVGKIERENHEDRRHAGISQPLAPVRPAGRVAHVQQRAQRANDKNREGNVAQRQEQIIGRAVPVKNLHDQLSG